jgi:hypothetical protein
VPIGFSPREAVRLYLICSITGLWSAANVAARWLIVFSGREKSQSAGAKARPNIPYRSFGKLASSWPLDQSLRAFIGVQLLRYSVKSRAASLNCFSAISS